MVEFKKYYNVVCCQTTVRHEAQVSNFYFPERVQHKLCHISEHINKQDAETALKKTLEEFEIKYPRKEGEVVVEKDFENNRIIIKLYTARHRNYFRSIDNTEIKRKTKPYFTIYRYYFVSESVYGYNNSEDWKIQDPYSDWEFEEPVW